MEFLPDVRKEPDMKLYAMKNIMTGEYERDNYGAIIVNDFEPTEPCEFCRDPDDLIVARYKPRKPGDPDPMMVAVEALFMKGVL
jgi:hypothetical protein